MIALGIDLKKEEVRWTVISGTRASPTYQAHGSEKYKLTDDRPELMSKFYKIFIELLAKHSPDKVGYRVSKNAAKIEQFAYMYFPYGLLNRICREQGKTTKEFNNRSFTYKLLGFAKAEKNMAACNRIFGSPSPHWDDSQRYSAMSAWGALDV